jgi:hypothetical protein
MATSTSLQRSVFFISVVFLVWSLAGLVANPDFATGSQLSSERFLGVDFNGWHALSGVLLFGPGLIAARRHDWAFLFGIAAIVSLVGSGAWALADSTPMGLWPLFHASGDAALHFGSALAYGVALGVAGFSTRRQEQASA